MRYSATLSAVWLLLSACSDTSIGSDECSNKLTRCEETEVTRQPQHPPSSGGVGQQIASDELPELAPVWQHALTFLPGQLPAINSGGSSFGSQGQLVGNGQAGLWYLRRATSDGFEVYRLDEDGEPIDSTLVGPPLADWSADGDRRPTIAVVGTVINDEGPAPILSLKWGALCASSVECANATTHEIVVLAEELHTPPLRIPISEHAFQIQAARSQDGGVWLFTREYAPDSPKMWKNFLRYDARGAIEVRQPVLERALTPFPTVGGELAALFSSEALVALGRGQAPRVYGFGDEGSPELWWLDPDGNVEHRYSLSGGYYDADFADTGDAILAIDREERAVSFVATSLGDLLVYRLDEAAEQSEMRLLRRRKFRSLAPISVTQDEAGNLYVISVGGDREVPLPMLCQLPLSGKMRCYALPELAVDDSVERAIRLIGGPDGVVYVYYLADFDDIENAREALARFELP